MEAALRAQGQGVVVNGRSKHGWDVAMIRGVRRSCGRPSSRRRCSAAGLLSTQLARLLAFKDEQDTGWGVNARIGRWTTCRHGGASQGEGAWRSRASLTQPKSAAP